MTKNKSPWVEKHEWKEPGTYGCLAGLVGLVIVGLTVLSVCGLIVWFCWKTIFGG